MTKLAYRLGEVMTIYWCHKPEALKTITYFHSGPGFSDLIHIYIYIYGTQYIISIHITDSLYVSWCIVLYAICIATTLKQQKKCTHISWRTLYTLGCRFLLCTLLY